jgi:intraflagellar transport protein 140
MHEEAEKLLMECNRIDLLNQLYQAMGNWEKALELSEKKDRINLRTTWYNYARYLEGVGDIQKAVTAYEKSETHV